MKNISDANTSVYFTSTNPQNGKKVFLITESNDKNLGEVAGCYECLRMKKHKFHVDVNDEGKFAFYTEDRMYLHKYVIVMSM